MCIVKNETNSDFVTSDDPSIFANRFYVQRLGRHSFGLMSSGALLFLPLTPRLLLMCYDGGVYTVPGKRGCCVPIAKQSDAFALNELQYLKAAENIYFAQWDDRSRIEREFSEVAPRRPQSWYRPSVFVLESVTERWERYRPATEEERKAAREMMVTMSVIHPAPSKWISKLKFRRSARTYFDGSAVGHVRKAEWLRSDARQRIGAW